MIEIYTDGSCCGNGKEHNHGGFGVAVLAPSVKTTNAVQLLEKYSEQHTDTTNNRMEIMALLKGLELAKSYGKENCVIKSDSAYCVNMFNDWIFSWSQNGWKRAGNKEIENLDLVKQLFPYALESFPGYRVEKVAGHDNILGNEIADALATNNQAKLTKIFENNDIGIVLTDFFDIL